MLRSVKHGLQEDNKHSYFYVALASQKLFSPSPITWILRQWILFLDHRHLCILELKHESRTRKWKGCGSVSLLNAVVGLFCKITNTEFGKRESASHSCGLNEKRLKDLGVLSMMVIFKSLFFWLSWTKNRICSIRSCVFNRRQSWNHK